MLTATGRPWWHAAAAIVVVALMLLWPALLNRQPMLFPDTVGYERAGVVALHVAGFDARDGEAGAAADTVAGVPHGSRGVSTVRSPFYGIPLAALLAVGGAWAAAGAQALIVAAALMLAARQQNVPWRVGVPAAGALIAVSGIAVFSSALMPDIFLALMILGFATLLAAPAMRRAETAFWLALMLAAMLFHKAFLAVAVGITLGALIAERRVMLRRGVLVLLATTCTLGAAGHFVVELAVKRYTGRESVGVPFMLARYAASPVLIDYLDDQCEVPQFALCVYRSRLPLQPDAFLWGPHNVYAGLSELERRAITEEATTVLGNAFAARPVATLLEAIDGSTRQFFTVGMSDYAIGVPSATRIDEVLAPTMRDYPASRVAQHSFPFDAAGGAALACYLSGLAALAVACWRLRPRATARDTADPDGAVFAATIVAGLIINAVISGSLSGVFDRYQGRIAWLAPYAAVLLLAGRAPRPGGPPRKTERPA